MVREAERGQGTPWGSRQRLARLRPGHPFAVFMPHVSTLPPPSHAFHDRRIHAMNALTLTFPITAADCLTGLRASLPALTDLLQEAAGRHADALGVGLEALRAQGLTWMLGRLALRLRGVPAWKDAVRVETWPNGVRGRLVAERQFRMWGSGGEPLLEASSEWLCVNFATRRLARLPEAVHALAAPDTPNLGFCAARPRAFPPAAALVGEATFPVRRAEIDANLHVNNGHYTRWMFETLPEARFFGPPPAAFDIEYKQSACLGDTVRALTYDLGGGHYAHAVTREPDGLLLARAHAFYPARLTA